MSKSRVFMVFFGFLAALALVSAPIMARAQDDDADEDDEAAEEEEYEEEEYEEEEYEEEEVEEEEEEVEEEEYEEEVEEEELEAEDEDDDDDDDEEEEEEEEEPVKEKKIREPLPEVPPIGVSLLEGKWLDLYFTGAVVALYELQATGLTSDPDVEHTFNLHHALMGFRGEFWQQRLEFEVLGDMAEWINPNEFFYDSSFLLDAFVAVNPLRGLVDDELAGLSIRMGRFVPGFGYYQNQFDALIDTIYMPAITGMHPGRQMGIEVEYSHKYFAAAVGVFNGMRFLTDTTTGGSNIWLGPGFRGATLGNVQDDYKGKDIMVRLSGKAPFGLRVDGFFYMARPEFMDATTGTHAVGPAFTYGGEVLFCHLFNDYYRLKLVANFTGRTMTYPSVAGGGKIHPAVTQYGMLFHAGMKIGAHVEPMLRLDFWNGRASDFNSPAPGVVFYGQAPDGSIRTMASGDTWEMWITGGLNVFMLGEHFRTTLTGTYVHRQNDALRDDFWLGLQAAAVI